MESLVAFVLISLLLMFYLPAFYPELGRLQAERLRTAQWRLFYELTAVELQSAMPDEQKAQMKAQLQKNYTTLHQQSVTFFSCGDEGCRISFEDGSEWHVSLENTE